MRVESIEVIFTLLQSHVEQICIFSAVQVISRNTHLFCPLNKWHHAIYREEVDVGIFVTTTVFSHGKSKTYSLLLGLNN